MPAYPIYYQSIFSETLKESLSDQNYEVEIKTIIGLETIVA